MKDKPPAQPRKQVDWEAIEREYRAGQLSVSAIGRLHEISHTAINKRAKRHDWTQNLSERIREEVSTRLVSEGVSAQSARETIELAAERQIQIIREHRVDIGAGRKVVKTILQELQDSCDNVSDIEAAIELETKEDETSKRKNMMLKAVSIGARSSSILALSSAMKNLVALERQAFGLTDKPEDDDKGALEVTFNTVYEQR